MKLPSHPRFFSSAAFFLLFSTVSLVYDPLYSRIASVAKCQLLYLYALPHALTVTFGPSFVLLFHPIPFVINFILHSVYVVSTTGTNGGADNDHMPPPGRADVLPLQAALLQPPFPLHSPPPHPSHARRPPNHLLPHRHRCCVR
jgi:hypothetical protein